MNEITESPKTEETQETSAQDTSTPEVASPKKKGGVLWIVLAILLIAIGVGVAYTMGVFGDKEAATDETVQIDPATVVATVNGAEITYADLSEKIEQVKNTVPVGAADPTTDPAFQETLLEELVNVTLLTSLAKDRGFTASEEDVDREIATLVEMFGGEALFNEQLAATKLTREELRDNMQNEIVIRQLINEDTDIETITVTDAEIKTAYDAAAELAPETAPPFDQVEELLRTQLIQEKSGVIIDDYIAAAREAANIDIAL